MQVCCVVIVLIGNIVVYLHYVVRVDTSLVALMFLIGFVFAVFAFRVLLLYFAVVVVVGVHVHIVVVMVVC